MGKGQYTGRTIFRVFCASASITIALTFELSTTQSVTRLWTLANAMNGGAIAGLFILFPTELTPLRYRTWIRFVFYGISFGLAIWGWIVLYDPIYPLAYVQAWRFSYYYTSISLVFYFITMIYRLNNNLTAEARQQIRIIMFGSLCAFIAVIIWYEAPLLNIAIAWNPILFYPTLLFFPLSVGIAILRYKLWDIGIIIRRTVVYTVLTGLLAIIYYSSVMLLSALSGWMDGKTSPFALVVSTLVIATLFAPLRQQVQTRLDKRFFRQKYNAEKALASFGHATRDEVELDNLVAQLTAVLNETVQPEFITLYLQRTTVHPANEGDITHQQNLTFHNKLEQI